MKIALDHMMHGAALIQIAEHRDFTAINRLVVRDRRFENAYEVNNGIGVFMKYARKPNAGGEYLFNFNQGNLDDLQITADMLQRLFLGLVCYKAKEICCLQYDQLRELLERRRDAAEREEPVYSLLVTLDSRRPFRVYVNAPGRKRRTLGVPTLVPRRAFPDDLFAQP